MLIGKYDIMIKYQFFCDMMRTIIIKKMESIFFNILLIYRMNQDLNRNQNRALIFGMTIPSFISLLCSCIIIILLIYYLPIFIKYGVASTALQKGDLVTAAFLMK